MNISQHTASKYRKEILFPFFLAWARTRASFRGSIFAPSWFFIEPALRVAIYGAVFGLLIPPSSQLDYFLPSLVVGVAIFSIFQQALTKGSSFVRTSIGLREITGLPVSSSLLATVIEINIRGGAYILVTVIFLSLSGFPPSLTWGAFIICIALNSLIIAGILHGSAFLANNFPNFHRLIPSINRILFYSSGVFWSLDKVLANYPTLLAIGNLNPLYQAIVFARQIFLGTNFPPSSALAAYALAAAVVFGAGTLLARISHWSGLK